MARVPGEPVVAVGFEDEDFDGPFKIQSCLAFYLGKEVQGGLCTAWKAPPSLG